jgi:hypothetical protein
MHSFYKHTSQKPQKTDGLTFFAVLGSEWLKTLIKHVGEIELYSQFHQHFMPEFSYKSALHSFYFVMFWL